jgi:hypothetical protein
MIESLNTERCEVIERHNVPTGYRLPATGLPTVAPLSLFDIQLTIIF